MSLHKHPVVTSTALLIGLLLLFWATRLIAIEQFPMFTDEAFHIRFARNVVEQGPFSNAEEGRQLTIWLYALVQADQQAAIFTARVATLLAVLPGLAAMMASGRLLAGPWAGLFTGLLMLFSVYHMFFERLALADPVSASAFGVALFFTLRLTRRVDFRDALVAGLMLFLAFGAKVLALPLLATPLAAWLFLRRTRRGFTWAMIALGVGAGLSALFAALLSWRGHNPFFYLLRGTGSGGGGPGETLSLLLSRIPGNAGSNWANLSGFLGLPLLLLLLLALAILLWRRHWFLPALLAGILAVYWLNNRPDTRHLIIPLNLALLAGAVVLADLVRGRSRAIHHALLIAVVLFGLVVWLPFTLTLNRDPAGLQLPWNDYHQYIASEASGSGLEEVIAILQAEQPQQVLGLLANCWALEYMVQDDELVPLTCPPVNPNGSTREALAELLTNSREPGVYAVLEDIAYLPESAPGSLIAVVERPAAGPRLEIYAMAP